MNFDKFDLIVRVHRFFGLKYYCYYELEKKWKIVSHALHQIIIYLLIIYLCSPCLMNDINCSQSIKSSTDKSFRQIMIYLVIRNSIVFLSMITFSLRGKMFKKLIQDLRKLFSMLHKKANGRQLFKAIYISIIIFCSFSIFESILLSIFFYSEERVLSLKTIYLFIAELHLAIILFLFHRKLCRKKVFSSSSLCYSNRSF